MYGMPSVWKGRVIIELTVVLQLTVASWLTLATMIFAVCHYNGGGFL